jgi:ssDNA-binding Zn-finger/Zn-ribbon topoisomerase 1
MQKCLIIHLEGEGGRDIVGYPKCKYQLPSAPKKDKLKARQKTMKKTEIIAKAELEAARAAVAARRALLEKRAAE